MVVIYVSGGRQVSKKRYYANEEYEEIYNIDSDAFGDNQQERLEILRNRSVSKYRVKTIRSGDMLEVEAYPLFDAPAGKRGKRKNSSTAAQKNLNNKNTKKRIVRLTNANFTNDDVWSTLTYDNNNLPADEEQAKKDMQNYLRRVKRHIKKHNLPDLKYIYVTEYSNTPGKKVRIHHHIITNFRDRDTLEDLWHGGGRSHTRRLRADDYGFEGLVRYITKDVRETKRYSVSRNLTKPKVTVADSKLTRRRAHKIATQEVDAQEIFEKMYEGYKFNDIDIKFSEWTSGAYLYVRMKRSDLSIRGRGRKDE